MYIIYIEYQQKEALSTLNLPQNKLNMATKKDKPAAPALEAPAINNVLPASVKLTVFALYERLQNGLIRPLHGISDVRHAEDGKIDILTSGVPYRSKSFIDQQIPDGEGLLMLYGGKDVLDELMYWRRVAREENASFAWAEVEVEVGYLEPLQITRELLRDPRRNLSFINFRRVSVDLQNDVSEAFATLNIEKKKLKKAETAGAETKTAVQRVVEIALTPEHWPTLCADDEDFSRLGVIVVPVADDPSYPTKIRQVAFVRPSAKIIKITQGSTDARIVLPSWMTGAQVFR